MWDAFACAGSHWVERGHLIANEVREGALSQVDVGWQNLETPAQVPKAPVKLSVRGHRLVAALPRFPQLLLLLLGCPWRILLYPSLPPA
jgi:hypothetical protein